jgi:hypothetical protein
VQISGVPAFGRRWDIRGGHGAVEAAPSA